MYIDLIQVKCIHRSRSPTVLQASPQLLFGSVEIVHVGCVMPAIMQLHNFAGDHRLQRIVRVRQIGQGVLLAGQSAHGCTRLPRVPQEKSSRRQHFFHPFSVHEEVKVHSLACGVGKGFIGIGMGILISQKRVPITVYSTVLYTL